MKFRRLFYVTFLALVMIFVLTLQIFAAQYTIKIGHVDGVESRKSTLSEYFAKLVEEDLGEGVVEFLFYPAGTLGTLTEQVEGLQVGTHDMTMTMDRVAAFVPELSVFDLPFLFTTREQVERVIYGSDVFDRIRKKVEEKGIIILGMTENGFRSVTNNVKPIRTPEDLKGLKLRTPPNPVRLAMFQAWGANPAPLSMNELFSALQQGVFDGQENPLNVTESNNLYEVQKYISITKHVYNPQLILMSKILWDKLPRNVQASLLRAGQLTGDFDRRNGEAQYQQSYDFLSKHCEINDDVDIDAFKEASKIVYDEFAYQDLLKEVQEIIK